MGHGPKRYRTFHINGMKEWYAPTAAVFLAVDDNPNEEASEVKGGTIPETNEIVTHICSCHNFFPLSSVQIIVIPACCLLCVL